MFVDGQRLCGSWRSTRARNHHHRALECLPPETATTLSLHQPATRLLHFLEARASVGLAWLHFMSVCSVKFYARRCAVATSSQTSARSSIFVAMRRILCASVCVEFGCGYIYTTETMVSGMILVGATMSSEGFCMKDVHSPSLDTEKVKELMLHSKCERCGLCCLVGSITGLVQAAFGAENAPSNASDRYMRMHGFTLVQQNVFGRTSSLISEKCRGGKSDEETRREPERRSRCNRLYLPIQLVRPLHLEPAVHHRLGRAMKRQETRTRMAIEMQPIRPPNPIGQAIAS